MVSSIQTYEMNKFHMYSKLKALQFEAFSIRAIDIVNKYSTYFNLLISHQKCERGRFI